MASQIDVVNTVRLLAADMVQSANSGHPGAPMGCAPMAVALFSDIIRFDPEDSKWLGRDRFVLSNGHGCALQYSMLHLTGQGLTIDDLKGFRQLGSKTPGHPEAHVTRGVEVTTGPLGQGVSSAVGLAIGEAHLRAKYNGTGESELDGNYTYVIVGDGCLQEGVSSEASSLAGHLGLGRLIVLWDDNHITIDGPTELSFSEDVLARYRAYGWSTLEVEDGDTNVDAIRQAVLDAKDITDKPTLIRVRTTIGFGAPKQGTAGVHGAPLGAEGVAVVKEAFGFDKDAFFVVKDDVKAYWAKVQDAGKAARAAWDAKFAALDADKASFWTSLNTGELPAGWEKVLPTYSDADPKKATRVLSQDILNALWEAVPQLIGGSADLAGSNGTKIAAAKNFSKEDPTGRYIRFGVREHAMAAISNGLAAYGYLPFNATFMNFIQYSLGAVRVGALSEQRVIHIMTHDSVFLGEDGPTHQPIETLALLRAMPGIQTFRPAAGAEVAGAYISAVATNGPTVLVLTRQGLDPTPPYSAEKTATYGGYVVSTDDANPAVVLVATGSEVGLALEGAALLKAAGTVASVVSIPCLDLLAKQDASYLKTLFPAGVPVLAIEAAASFGWSTWSHGQLAIDRFGLSAPFADVVKTLGFTPEKVKESADALITKFGTSAPALQAF